MTNVNARFFDELASVLKRNNVGNALVLQIADVLNRNCLAFRREWWAAEAGYVPPPSPATLKAKTQGSGAGMKVVPITQHRGDHGNDPVLDLGWDEISADDAIDPDAFKPKGYEQ